MALWLQIRYAFMSVHLLNALNESGQSRELYGQFLEKLRNMYQAERIVHSFVVPLHLLLMCFEQKDGRFQAMMQVLLYLSISGSRLINRIRYL